MKTKTQLLREKLTLLYTTFLHPCFGLRIALLSICRDPDLLFTFGSGFFSSLSHELYANLILVFPSLTFLHPSLLWSCASLQQSSPCSDTAQAYGWWKWIPPIWDFSATEQTRFCSAVRWWRSLLAHQHSASWHKGSGAGESSHKSRWFQYPSASVLGNSS